MRLHRALSFPLLTLFAGVSLNAAIILDFEGFADSTILTSEYSGLTFSNAIALTAGISLNEFEFPPKSGSVVISDNGGPIQILFDTPVVTFSGFFTYLTPLTLTGFDGGNAQVALAMSAFNNNLACLAGPPCSGDPGSNPNELLSLDFVGGLSRVLLTGSPAGGSFTLDDLTYNTAPTAIPEPSTLILLLTAGGAFLLCRHSTR